MLIRIINRNKINKKLEKRKNSKRTNKLANKNKNLISLKKLHYN